MANAALGRILLAALGVLAYKNRDRLGDVFRPTQTNPNNPGQRDGGGLFDQLSQTGGLGELLEKFRSNGIGGVVDSWIGNGKNDPIEPAQVAEAIDEDTLQSLVKQTGMTREEILARLAVNLPYTVDALSPDGRLPAEPASGDGATLLDPAPPFTPKMSGAPAGDVGTARSPVADRNTDGPRQDGASPRPTDDPVI